MTARNKPAVKFWLTVAALWIIATNIDGALLFETLQATHQIKYTGILRDPKLPLIYALGFEYTPASLLRALPFSGFNDGVFIAYNPTKTKNRPGIFTHELRHTWQRTVGGPFTILAYSEFNTFNSQKGFSYWETYLSNPLERDAYHFSGEVNKYNELIDQHAPKLQHLKMPVSP